MTLEHTKEALKRLRRELNVPMDKADVVEVDIAENFEVENSPELYISKMQSLGTSHPNKWKGTTYFPISGSMLRFFMIRGRNPGRGASVAISEKAAPLPERERKNLLRYEMKFKKAKIRQVFGRQLKSL